MNIAINAKLNTNSAVKVVEQACLVLFCKRPKLYQGKQRLAKDIGADRALGLAEAFLECALEDASNWPGAVVIAVAHEQDLIWASQFLKYGYAVIQQSQGGLGDRLNAADAYLRKQGFEHLVFIGTDSPTLSSQYYGEAIKLLQNDQVDTVLSPAEDGGVVLMASNTPWPDISDLPWSTPRLGCALAACFKKNGLRVAHMRSGFDVDHADVLPQLQRSLIGDTRPARQNLLKILRAKDH